MEGRSSLVNALITLTIIAILAVIACMFKMRGKSRQEARDRHAFSAHSTAHENPSDGVASAYEAYGANQPPYNPLPAPDRALPEDVASRLQSVLQRPTPTGPENGVSGYEILLGSTFVQEDDHSGSRFRINHQGREIGLQLYFADCPELPDVLPGMRQADLSTSTFAESSEEKSYFDSRDFTRGILGDTPFHVFTCWEPTGNANEFYGFVFVLDEEKPRRRWLSELLAAGGHARVRLCHAPVPDGRTSAQQFSAKLEGYLESSRQAAARATAGGRPTARGL